MSKMITDIESSSAEVSTFDLKLSAEHLEKLPSDTIAQLDKQIRRKFDRRVLPFCILMYLGSMIDRSNMGNAKVLGLQTDLSLATGNRFNIVLSVFFITYILFELPANMLCKRLGPKMWLAGLTMSFGLVTMCFSFVQNYGGALAARVCLGMCEAGILPGIMYTLSRFYKRHELATRMGYLSSVVSLSGAFGGLLATGFSRIPASGMMNNWRYVFLFEGILTILIGASVLMMPNSPETASFLTEEERKHATSRLIEEYKAMPHETIDRTTFRRAIFHIPTQTVGIALICSLCAMQSLALFTPTILTGMGYTGQQAQLLSVPPYVLGAIVCITVSTLSDKFRNRGFFIMFLLAPCIFIGFTLNLCVQSVAVRYFGLFIAVAGGFCCSPLLLAWVVDNNSGHAVKAIAAPYAIAVGGFGQLLSTWTYLAAEAPKYTAGHSINMACACVIFVCAGIHSAYAIRENKKRAAGERDGRLEKEAEGLGHDHPEFRFTP